MFLRVSHDYFAFVLLVCGPGVQNGCTHTHTLHAFTLYCTLCATAHNIVTQRHSQMSWAQFIGVDSRAKRAPTSRQDEKGPSLSLRPADCCCCCYIGVGIIRRTRTRLTKVMETSKRARIFARCACVRVCVWVGMCLWGVEKTKVLRNHREMRVETQPAAANDTRKKNRQRRRRGVHLMQQARNILQFHCTVFGVCVFVCAIPRGWDEYTLRRA